MYKAVRPYGSQSLPLKQDDDGSLLVTVKEGINVDFDRDSPINVNVVSGGGNGGSEPTNPATTTVIYPSPASFSKNGATVAEDGVFTVDDDVNIRLQYAGNLGDSVELLGYSSGVSAGAGGGLYRSVDNGETWTRILKAGSLTGYSQTTSSGEVVLVTVRDVNNQYTEVWMSDTLDNDDDANWTKVITASSGIFSGAYGKSVRGNVVLYSVYGPKDALNPPRHLYISRDFGRTFKEVEVRAIADMPDNNHFHLHDCEYDPFTGRIWVSNGDQSNSAIQFSDDWGESWYVISGKGQPTNIIALPDRILLGTDDWPDGFKVIYKNNLLPKQIYTEDDVKVLYATLLNKDASPPFKHVANNIQTRTDSQIDTYPYNLLAVFNGSGTTGVAILAASPDGKQFYPIATDVSGDMLIGSVIGPCSNDPEKRVWWGWYNRVEKANYIKQFNFPKWVVMK